MKAFTALTYLGSFLCSFISSQISFFFINRCSRLHYLKFLICLLFLPIALAAPPNGLTVYHPASQIIAGTFPENYTINGTLNITPSTTAGTNFFVTSAGLVGIGTASPTAGKKVDIVGSTPLLLRSADGANFNGVEFSTTTGAAQQIYTQYAGSATERALILGSYTYRATQLVLDTTGNVGIGTASPAQKLSINGNISVSSASGRFCINGDACSKYIWYNGTNVVIQG